MFFGAHIALDGHFARNPYGIEGIHGQGYTCTHEREEDDEIEEEHERWRPEPAKIGVEHAIVIQLAVERHKKR